MLATTLRIEMEEMSTDTFVLALASLPAHKRKKLSEIYGIVYYVLLNSKTAICRFISKEKNCHVHRSIKLSNFTNPLYYVWLAEVLTTHVGLAAALTPQSYTRLTFICK